MSPSPFSPPSSPHNLDQSVSTFVLKSASFSTTPPPPVGHTTHCFSLYKTSLLSPPSHRIPQSPQISPPCQPYALQRSLAQTLGFTMVSHNPPQDPHMASIFLIKADRKFHSLFHSRHITGFLLLWVPHQAHAL